MRIQFCGADRTVTGSCHLLEIDGLRVLLDCGIFQGQRELSRQLNQQLPDDPKSIDMVILSHGHLDHCGKLPVLTKAGFNGPIYCTPGTAEVARIILEDSAEIQEEDANYLNRRMRNPDQPQAQPSYRSADVPATLRQFRKVAYGQKTKLSDRVSFTFFDAGHILGSAYVWIEIKEDENEKKLLFTADIGRYHTPILRDPHPVPGPADIVITESTYGTRKHLPMSEVGPQFLAAIKSCIETRSRLLVPAFAVGRTQAMLWYCSKFIAEGSIPKLPIYVDSPMGSDVTRVYCEFTDNYDEETKHLLDTKDLFCQKHVTFTRTAIESRKINGDAGPCVIIASSPTCEFGRIRHHLIQSIEDPKDMVLFTGFIPANTLGRRIQEGAPRVRILDRWFDVRCRIKTLHGLSAHADGDELLKFLAPALKPSTACYVVHGEVPQAEGFAARLMSHGVASAVVPAMQSSALTSDDRWSDEKAQPELTRTDND